MAYKWQDADFFITKIRKKDGVIDAVVIRESKIANNEVDITDNEIIVPRQFVARLISKKLAVFFTAIQLQDDKWSAAEVFVYDEVFIKTENNKTDKDNLENLPTF